jgi:hypothetical protein
MPTKLTLRAVGYVSVHVAGMAVGRHALSDRGGNALGAANPAAAVVAVGVPSRNHS